MAFDGFDPYPGYVSAAERRRRAARALAALARRGIEPRPVAIEGREIAATFWGHAWCAHLESLADLATRLPRGRSYVRSGAVVHLAISPGEIRAFVSGTELYEARVEVAPLPADRWAAVRRACAGRIATVVELLSGRLAASVMELLCDRDAGLFPLSRELRLSCSCPDSARLCKHLAAVLYGVGARLDEAPELLFTLRAVEGAELVSAATGAGALAGGAGGVARRPEDALGEIFGIELERGGERPRRASSRPGAKTRGGKRRGAVARKRKRTRGAR